MSERQQLITLNTLEFILLPISSSITTRSRYTCRRTLPRRQTRWSASDDEQLLPFSVLFSSHRSTTSSSSSCPCCSRTLQMFSDVFFFLATLILSSSGSHLPVNLHSEIFSRLLTDRCTDLLEDIPHLDECSEQVFLPKHLRILKSFFRPPLQLFSVVLQVWFGLSALPRAFVLFKNVPIILDLAKANSFGL